MPAVGVEDGVAELLVARDHEAIVAHKAGGIGDELGILPVDEAA